MSNPKIPVIGMDVFAWNRAVLNKECTLPRDARLLLCVLLRYAKRKTGVAYPSVAVLAKSMGVSPRTARRAMVKLETRRIVRVIQPQVGRANRYYLPLHPDAVGNALTK